MRFHLEITSPWVAGWVAPDNPNVTPTLVVVTEGGRKRTLVPADHMRPELVECGFHNNGLCGFSIDPRVMPEVQPDHALEIFEAESNLLLFRRGPTLPAPVRLFHLETQAFPVYGFARHLSPVMQILYSNAETIGEDALETILNIVHPSMLLWGGLSYRTYEPTLRRHDFRLTIILCDPYRELAGRLFLAKSLAAHDEAGQGWRSLGQRELIPTFADVDLTDGRALARALKKLSDEAFFALANPTARKLALKSSNEALGPHHVGQALDTLADFDVVGFEGRLDRFLDDLEALLGRPGLPRTLEAGPPLEPIMAALRSCRPARELVALDELLNGLAREAVEKAEASAFAAEAAS